MNLDRNALPESLTEVVDTIGIDGALLLVEKFGGTRLYVPEPENLPGDHILVRLLGHNRAYALAQRVFGDGLNLPRCVVAVRALRDADIRAARNGGSSIRKLALKHGLTERQIYAILAVGEPEESPQNLLF